jgi:subtilisin
MGPEEVAALKVSDPGVRAFPVVKYHLARMPRLKIESKLKKAAGAKALNLSIRFVDSQTKAPIRGVQVAAFTDFENRSGAGGTSSANGRVSLDLGAMSVKLDVLVAYGPPGYWGLGRRAITLKTGAVFEIEPVNLATPDFAASLYGGYSADAGDGVVVGVIDTGIDGKHPDLTVDGGAAFVTDEGDAGGWGPATSEGEHGTHVAGIIASTGSTPPHAPKTVPGKRGVAPKVALRSYRVFPNSGEGADNYDIIRAIDQGVRDGCDLLNLSLGSEVPDEAVHVAIKDAFDRGTVCVVATGNDGRQPVSYPAAWDTAVAVTSCAKKGTYPIGSNEVLDEVPPYAKTDPNIYISVFSNVGPPVDVTGPGGGIVSTLPGGQYGVMSGTSMACPAVTGVLAALISADPAVMKMPRSRDRSVAILGLLTKDAKPLGFIPPMEGVGLL